MRFRPVHLLAAAVLAAVVPWAAAANVTASVTSVTAQVTDSKGVPLPDAVVYAEPLSGKIPPPGGRGAQIEQAGRNFKPLVTVVQTGSTITFPNNDTVRHQVYSFSPSKVFELKLYSGTSSSPQLFDKAGTVVLGCNIHDRMVAYVQVVDTPWFAKTDDNGTARIDNLPPGDYRLKAWHYDLKSADPPPEQHISTKGEALTVAIRLDVKSVGN